MLVGLLTAPLTIFRRSLKFRCAAARGLRVRGACEVRARSPLAASVTRGHASLWRGRAGVCRSIVGVLPTLMASSSRSTLACAAALVALVGSSACTTSASPVSPGAAPSSPEPRADEELEVEGPLVCVASAPVFHAFLRSGTCADVASASGVWIVSSLFPSAPASVRDVACTYTWYAKTDAIAADVGAFAAIDVAHLAENRDEVPVCLPPHRELGAALLVPEGGSATGIPTGVTGCDVCARVAEDGRVYVILPDDNLAMQRAIVERSDGAFVTLELTPPKLQAQVFAAPLPAGSYVAGAARVFERSL